MRQAPGRIIGVSVDAHGNHGVPHVAADARAAHPAREGDVEHLHRAGAAGEHRRLLRRVSRAEGANARSRAACTDTRRCSSASSTPLGIAQLNDVYFDTLRFETSDVAAREASAPRRSPRGMNLPLPRDGTINIALDETTDADDIDAIVAVFAKALDSAARTRDQRSATKRLHGRSCHGRFERTSTFLTHPGVQHASFRDAR